MMGHQSHYPDHGYNDYDYDDNDYDQDDDHTDYYHDYFGTSSSVLDGTKPDCPQQVFTKAQKQILVQVEQLFKYFLQYYQETFLVWEGCTKKR